MAKKQNKGAESGRGGGGAHTGSAKKPQGAGAGSGAGGTRQGSAKKK